MTATPLQSPTDQTMFSPRTPPAINSPPVPTSEYTSDEELAAQALQSLSSGNIKHAPGANGPQKDGSHTCTDVEDQSPLDFIKAIGASPNTSMMLDQIRTVEVDGVIKISVYDVMEYVCGIERKHHHTYFKRVMSKLNEDFKVSFTYWQFPGARQQKTPVANNKALLFFLMMLPGDVVDSNVFFQLAWYGLSNLRGDFSSISKESRCKRRPKEGHIYIVRLAQHELTNEPIWKVGMSVQGIDNSGKLRRLRDYGPDAKEYCCIPVENARETERKILDHVRSLDEFESMEEYGSEYFKGDLALLIKTLEVHMRHIERV